MNCADVVHFLIEPGQIPDKVAEHLNTCEACRAHAVESRRVAALLAELPFTPDTDVASRVMARIGYGNGRPTRDKILDQLERVRDELEFVVGDLEPGEADVRPSDWEPTVAQLLRHLPGVEATLQLEAELALGDGPRLGPWRGPGNPVRTSAPQPAADSPRAGASSAGASSAGASSGQRSGAAKPSGNGNGHGAKDGCGAPEELRRVRERTLRLISELGAKDLHGRAAELLRTIYRHEADHVAQIEDTRWRARRQEQLRSIT